MSRNWTVFIINSNRHEGILVLGEWDYQWEGEERPMEELTLKASGGSNKEKLIQRGLEQGFTIFSVKGKRLCRAPLA